MIEQILIALHITVFGISMKMGINFKKIKYIKNKRPYTTVAVGSGDVYGLYQ